MIPAGTADAVLDRMWPQEDPYLHDPVGWIEGRIAPFGLWSKQVEIAESVRDNRFTAVRACHGPGKSFEAAALIAWWLETHPVGTAFAVTTAPTDPQVKAILWREIGKAHRKAGLSGRITLDAQWYMGAGEKELVAYGRKPADYDQAAFQGIHARYVLVVMDEAGGIPQNLWDSVDSLATNADARVLAIGNPDDPASHFAKACSPGQGWNVVPISAFDTPAFTGEEVHEELLQLLTSREFVETAKRRWGEGSPLYTSKVLGEFPEVSDDTLISPALVAEAQRRHLPGFGAGRYGCDIARLGKDETAIYRNREGRIRLVESRHKQDTMRTTGLIAKHILAKRGEVPAVVDVIGIGAGVFDRLREQDLPVVGFNAAERAWDTERYLNRRAEAYWHLREEFEAGRIDLDPTDEDLAAQLSSIKYKHNSKGQTQIESKEKMQERGLPSPDRADAVMMSSVETGNWNLAEPVSGKSLTGDLLERAM